MDDRNAKLRIKRLLAEQRVGVLCTSVRDQPNGSPMAFVAEEDLGWLGFASDQNSYKARVLQQNPLTAFVVDNRTTRDLQAGETEVVVIKGITRPVAGEADQQTRERLAERHPAFESFFRSRGTVVYRMNVEDIVYDVGLVAIQQAREQRVG
jgi:nitroimidazol reductase NimA-like FMN-containing flavoprotein (pyridoxamine 5'-phosphate oxidase superfamily)